MWGLLPRSYFRYEEEKVKNEMAVNSNGIRSVEDNMTSNHSKKSKQQHKRKLVYSEESERKKNKKR